MDIPVIDLSSLSNTCTTPSLEVITAIRKACLDVGFFYVVNHGIDNKIQEKVLEKLWQFFTLPSAKKAEIHRRDGFRGYFCQGEEFNIEQSCAEWKEGIYYFRDFTSVPQDRKEVAFCGANPWPKEEDVPDFQEVVQSYFEKTQKLASSLLCCIALSLGLEEDFFTKKFTQDPFAQIGMFHYPPHSASKEDHEVWGVGRHTDYGVLTILLQDEVGGLQVETKDGSWIEVPPVPGSFVVNLGDMLEVWTSGALRAGPHRVKTSPTKHRLSVAMFYGPGFDCVVSPIPLDKTLIPLECTANKLSLNFPVRYGDYVLKKYCGILPQET
ncbi:probable iron/ascorbate oxidoreductase DDB_G0283291 [Montipora capricornis]|uniref:probable iron/ascorbate oxidoreductase DDB_G0283291 n=1 Tax=Montipora foliosa TaxID=591990 RepID=UPI0035F18D43